MLLEAQSSGVPVVAFDVGGVGEAVQNGETGFLAKIGNTNEFAEAILKLLSDASLRERMGANGRIFVVNNYTWNICAEKMLQVYCESLNNL